MKPFVKKIMLPTIFAAFVCFYLTEQSGFVHRFATYIPASNYYNIGSFAASRICSSNADDSELLLVVVEITDECSDHNKDAYQFEGNVQDYDLVLFHEGIENPTIVLQLKPIAGTNLILNDGPCRECTHEVTLGVGDDFISRLSMTYEPY